MTKNEYIAEAKLDAVNSASDVLNEALIRQLPDEVARMAVLEASRYQKARVIKSSVYAEAFVEAFTGIARQAYNRLPDVVAARRHERIEWKLQGMSREATDALAKFKRGLDDDPEYAFRWADGAMAAAAVQHAVAVFRKVATHHRSPSHDGVDAAIAYATEEALRGARSPSQSTSVCSNVMAQATTAAFAELADLRR